MGTARVAKVISPYTVQLDDGRTLWLVNIEYPGYDPHEPSKLTLTALDILRDMLEGQTIEIYQSPKKGVGRLNRMGHHLAHIKRQDTGLWVQGTLTALGLAFAYPLERNPEMMRELLTFEENARTQKLGIWDESSDFTVRSPDTIENHLNSYQIVEGQIRSTTLKNNRIFINFGQDWRTDFTIAIPPGDKRKFTKAGLDPMNWNQRRIQVRGWARSYNGPYIEITHPEMIKLYPESPIENPTSPLNDPS